jgi:hypothetical protein
VLIQRGGSDRFAAYEDLSHGEMVDWTTDISVEIDVSARKFE